MRKKIKLEPMVRKSKISGDEYVEKVLLVDDGYPETLIHMDCFYDPAKPTGYMVPHGEIYEALKKGETLEVWMTLEIVKEERDDY